MSVDTNKTTEELLRELVAMPTLTDDTVANHTALEYVQAFLEQFDLTIKRHQWNGFESLTATTRNTKTPTLCFGAHVDVVPAPEGAFHLQKEDGKYLGRGVRDMKGAIAAYLRTIADLGDDLKHYDLGLMITTDEEIGGMNGAGRLARAGYIPKVLVLPDGGDNWDLEKSAKGIWHFTLSAKGQNAHASRPWEGENAIDKVITAVHGIKALFPIEQLPETNTINIGNIHGGDAINQIAAEVSVGIDMRFISPAEERRIVTAVMQITKAQGLELHSVAKADPIVNDPTNYYLETYAACTKEIVGKAPEWIVSNGASDARFFVNKGTVCIVSYPPGGNHHGHNEWITEESLEQMHQLFLTYAKQVARIPAAEKLIVA